MLSISAPPPNVLRSSPIKSLLSWSSVVGIFSTYGLRAAEATDAETAGAAAMLLGLGFTVVAAIFVLYLIFNAIFIHMAAGFMHLPNRRFGTACVAAFVNFLLSFVVPTLVSFIGGLILGALKIHSQALLGALVVFAVLLPGTLAIKLSYGADFIKSFMTYIISLVLTVIAVVICAFGLVALIGNSGPVS